MMIKQNVIEQQMGQKRNWKLRNTLNKSRNMMRKNLKNVVVRKKKGKQNVPLHLQEFQKKESKYRPSSQKEGNDKDQRRIKIETKRQKEKINKIGLLLKIKKDKSLAGFTN